MSHAVAPRLNLSAFGSLFDALAAVSTKGDLHGQGKQDSPGPSRQSSAGPGNHGSQAALSGPISDLALDVIWAADLEIDLCREAAESDDAAGLLLGQQSPADASKGKAKGSQTQSEAASAAKARIAELVGSLIVSCTIIVAA